jgi:hypothetical protein
VSFQNSEGHYDTECHVTFGVTWFLVEATQRKDLLGKKKKSPSHFWFKSSSTSNHFIITQYQYVIPNEANSKLDIRCLNTTVLWISRDIGIYSIFNETFTDFRQSCQSFVSFLFKKNILGASCIQTLTFDYLFFILITILALVLGQRHPLELHAY